MNSLVTEILQLRTPVAKKNSTLFQLSCPSLHFVYAEGIKTWHKKAWIKTTISEQTILLLVKKLASHPVSLQASQTVSQPASQTVSQPASQTVSQPASQPASQPISLSVSHYIVAHDETKWLTWVPRRQALCQFASWLSLSMHVQGQAHNKNHSSIWTATSHIAN